ncbi:MAG: endonuclease [Myxococcota bacterium]
MMILAGCGDNDAGSTGGAADTAAGEVDADSDGFTADEDCDDESRAVYPGAVEICDGQDSDCDGQSLLWEEDTDGDGVLDCNLCAQYGFWPEILDVVDNVSMEAFFEANLTTTPCTQYQTERSYLFQFLDNTDDSVECIYTAASFVVSDADPNWSIVNTEHVWPRSDGAQFEPVECDLHHLYPAEVDANAKRASTPFGEVVDDVVWSVGGSRLGDDASGQQVFEPRDEKKGDVARAILYISARYPDQVDQLAQVTAAREATLRSWHLSDPPDAVDAERSRLIAGRQGHANPFVVCPRVTELY